LLVVSVDERYPRNGVKAMLGLWGIGQLLLTKCMVTVSSDVNPRDFSSVLREIGENYDPREDFLLIPWAPLDTLDFTSGKLNVGSKMGINAVRKRGKKIKYAAKVPDPGGKHKEVMDYRLLDGGFLVLKIQDGEDPKKLIQNIFKTPGFGEVRIVAVVSSDIVLSDDTEVIWGIFTRFDPYLDVIFEKTQLRGSAVIYDGRMGIDATIKRWYPEVIEMSEDIREKVTKKWNSYWEL